MQKSLDGWAGGIAINGQRINNLRFSDDTALLANSQDELIEIMMIENESELLGLELNTSKAKIIILGRQHNNLPELTEIDRFQIVSKYIYLVLLISNTGSEKEEIKRRCDLTKVAMINLNRI